MAGPYRYWRINATSVYNAWPALAFAEAQFRVVAGGGKTAPTAITCAKVLAGYPETNVNDGNFNTFFSSDGSLGLPVALVFDFGAPVSFAELALAPRSDILTYSPQNFTVDGSTDAVTWVNVVTFNAVPQNSWVANQFVKFPLNNAGASSGLNNSQLASIVVASGTPNLRASQLATVTVEQMQANLRASQLALVVVIANGKNFLPLGPVMPLPCWQPCTAYGTRSIVIRFN